MDRARIERMAQALDRPEIAALDPDRLATLRRALDGADPPLAAGRHGALIAFSAGTPRRRLLELDRRGHLVAAFRWAEDGRLAWAKCRTAHGDWIGVEPGAGARAAWGDSDAICRLAPDAVWKPRESLTVFQAVDWARLEWIPPLAAPQRLPPGAGTAVLNLIAGLMKDQGLARARYRGPYPSETLFTALLECFRHDPAAAPAPLEPFLAAGELDWLPAPHERHWVAAGVCVQLRQEIDKVVLDGVPYYRPDWQNVGRREPRLIRTDEGLRICVLWALGRALEERLVLAPDGEIVRGVESKTDSRAPAPLTPVWRPALAALIARESAPLLGPAIGAELDELVLEWGPVPGDLLRIDGDVARVRRQLLDVGLEWIRDAEGAAARGERAGTLALEVARLLAPELRRRAQARLEALPADEQQRLWEASQSAEPPPLGEAVGRLLALLTRGTG
jgi:hypothetical protein